MLPDLNVLPPDDGSAASLSMSVIREPGVAAMTPSKRRLCWDYGIPPREAPREIAGNRTVSLTPGTITLLTGPSGSGKSTALSAIADRAPHALRADAAPAAAGDAPVVDLVMAGQPLKVAIEILTACGLGEPRLWIRRLDDLSEGERFRAGLARAIGAAVAAGTMPVICCDEFTSLLHRRLAKAVSHNLRKLVTRHHLILVVATAHDDIIPDLAPDRIIDLGTSGGDATAPHGIHAARQGGTRRTVSMHRHAIIERGGLGDYARFSPMHYRHRDNLGFVDKIFLLRERTSREALGIVVYAHAPLELAMRNRTTRGRFVCNPRRLNRELRILRRLIMHPDVRGCGLGHWLVRRTLPRVGVRFIECLAAMGDVNPVFERAGLTRVGECPLPRGRVKLLERMRAAKVDPFADDFTERVARCPRVRRLVEETVVAWVGTMHGGQKAINGKWDAVQMAQSFRQIIGRPPVYYLWDREGEYPVPMDGASSDVQEMSNGTDVTRPTETRRARSANKANRPAEEPRHARREVDRHRPEGRRIAGE